MKVQIFSDFFTINIKKVLQDSLHQISDNSNDCFRREGTILSKSLNNNYRFRKEKSFSILKKVSFSILSFVSFLSHLCKAKI